jgi:transcriptional regulator with XRE-family HTH domain
VAECMKTAQSHVANIELGKTDPSTDTIAGLAEALQVDSGMVFAAVRAQRAVTRGVRDDD